MLSGLEDFLHIWKRFSILQLPASAVHKPPRQHSLSAPRVSTSPYTERMHVLVVLQVWVCFFNPIEMIFKSSVAGT